MIIFDIETTGLNPLKDILITIQVKHNKDVNVWKTWEIGEKSTIMKFIDFIRPVDEPIVGYNIDGFDINFLMFRMLYNGILSDENKKIMESKNWVDILQFQNGNGRGLEEWSQNLGVSKGKEIKGGHIKTLYELKMYDKIVRHGIDDLELCEKILEKLGIGESSLLRL